jgi:hypothetical protein
MGYLSLDLDADTYLNLIGLFSIGIAVLAGIRSSRTKTQ